MKKLLVLCLAVMLTACTPYPEQRITNHGVKQLEDGVYLKLLTVSDGFLNTDSVYVLVDSRGRILRGNMSTVCRTEGENHVCTAVQNSIPD